MGLCPHRGFPVETGKRCPYHGLLSPVHPTCFDREPKRPGYDEVLPEFQKLIMGTRGERFDEVVQEVACPWWLWMQNTADYRHLATVHKDGFADLFTGPPYAVRISMTGRHSTHKLKVRALVRSWYEKQVGRELDDYFLHSLSYPNLSMTAFLGVFFSREIASQGSPDRTVVTTSFFADPSVPRWLLDAAMVANRRVLAEDKALCEEWAPTARVTGNWLPGEERIRSYCELLKEDGYID